GLDYVDIFYSHRPTPDTPLEETMGALATALQQGKALYAGISSYSAERTAEAATILRSLGAELLIHQPSYSMLNRWTLRDPRVTSTLIGASSVEQLEENVAALDRLDFSDDELAEIDRHATESGINLWPSQSES
ncbi:MAG: aldo/keto reductase, partial [Gaiellaceae bacterium]